MMKKFEDRSIKNTEETK